MLQDAEKLLMDDLYRNPGPLQFEGPGSDNKTISLTAEEQDYIGKIKELQAYLDKVHLTTFSHPFFFKKSFRLIQTFFLTHPNFPFSSKNLKH